MKGVWGFCFIQLLNILCVLVLMTQVLGMLHPLMTQLYHDQRVLGNGRAV